MAAAAAGGRILCTRIPVPFPVLLLGVGMAAGVDGAGIIKVEELGSLVPFAVAVAVALIVFEGGTRLNLRGLRRTGPVVRNLVVGGLVVTPLVGMLAAALIVGLPWRTAALFGALVCVTGPSVIGPLLRAVRVNDKIRTALLGEGVIIDPFGALLTLFLLDIALAESVDPGGPARWVISRVALGVATGAAGAAVVYGVTRVVRRLEGHEVALLAVGAALGVFGISETLGNESGLTAMVVMGIALGSLPIPHREAMDQFQETIVAFLVASVYVLLAASVSLESLGDLWPAGFLAVGVLMVVGRPLLVALATWRSDLNVRERLFLAAVAPRGVVAASLASVVAVEAEGRLGGAQDQLVALVFLVILMTIGLQSAYAPLLSRVLRVTPERFVVVGFGEVGRRVATRLSEAGEPVLVVDADEGRVVEAREAGFEGVFGDIATPEVLKQIDVTQAKGLIFATENDERALLAARLAQQMAPVKVYARVMDPANIPAFEASGITVVSPAIAVADELASMVTPSPLGDIMAAAEGEYAVLRLVVANPRLQGQRLSSVGALRGALVVLVRRRGAVAIPSGNTVIQLGDVLTVVTRDDRAEDLREAIEGVPATL
ncbi:MAG: sodium/hydrogen antiporter [Tepidiforma sp.]|nr:MAG: sodium/hydrogen antiporter [Tepidiforma sp.]